MIPRAVAAPSRIPVTISLALAAGQDAGNRSMRAAGRSAWSEDDWNAAAAVTDELCGRHDAAMDMEDSR